MQGATTEIRQQVANPQFVVSGTRAGIFTPVRRDAWSVVLQERILVERPTARREASDG
jgi:hypothetical protein